MEKFSRNPRRPPQFFHTVEIIFPWRGKSQNKLSIPWKTCAAGARQQLVADAPALQLARQRATAQLSGRGRRPQGAIDQTRARTRQRHTRHRAQRPHPQNAHRLFELRRQRQHAGQVTRRLDHRGNLHHVRAEPSPAGLNRHQPRHIRRAAKIMERPHHPHTKPARGLRHLQTRGC